MLKNEVLTTLRNEGYPIRPHEVDYAVANDKIDRPSIDSAGNRIYRASHVKQLRALLIAKRKRLAQQV